MIRVLLVDDHAVMRAGFRMILDSDPEVEVVGEAGTGAEALAAAPELRPDVICMDVQMPDMDGIEATRRLTADPDNAAAIVIVTTFDRDDYLFEALTAGASGFLLKNADPADLLQSVRVAAAGDALLSPEVTRRVIERFTGASNSAQTGEETAADPAVPDRDGHPVSPVATSAVTVELTDRETEVLRLVAEALSNAEIARRLFIGEATVKTHVSNVLGKLGARDRVAAVVYAHRHGLV